jgi:glycosyltransferase involved in cell wall biosynthesis
LRTDTADQIVSVIVPAKNASQTLDLCIASVQRQTYSPVELIVVDNGSIDATYQIAATAGARVATAGGKTPTARNVGATLARGYYLLHLDADMELAHDSIEECVRVAASGSDAVILPETNVCRGFWMRSFSFLKEVVRGVPGFETPRFLTASLFRRLGGYDESLWAGEERDLGLRLIAAGASIGRIRPVTRHHVEHLTIQEAMAKTSRYAVTRDAFERKHPAADAVQGRSYMSVLRYSWPKMIRAPHLTFGWLVLTALSLLRDQIQAIRKRQTRQAQAR